MRSTFLKYNIWAGVIGILRASVTSPCVPVCFWIFGVSRPFVPIWHLRSRLQQRRTVPRLLFPKFVWLKLAIMSLANRFRFISENCHVMSFIEPCHSWWSLNILCVIRASDLSWLLACPTVPNTDPPGNMHHARQLSNGAAEWSLFVHHWYHIHVNAKRSNWCVDSIQSK